MEDQAVYLEQANIAYFRERAPHRSPPKIAKSTIYDVNKKVDNRVNFVG